MQYDPSSQPQTETGQRVVVIDTGYPSYQQERALLEAAGYRLDVFQGDRRDRDQKKRFAREAVGLFARWTKIDAEFLDAVPDVRAVVRSGVGYDSVDLPAASARGVRVANVAGYASRSVAEHALALMFAAVRSLSSRGTDLRAQFENPPSTRIFELHDKTLGIVGLGNIGGTLCQKAQTLFARVLACDPYLPADRFAELGATRASLATVLAESHVISLHCNLTQETTRLIDHAAFTKMRQHPILVNTARGKVIDEDALLEALQSDRLHSACLDVFSEEPPPPSSDALLAHPHLLATGHHAWYSDTALAELQRRAAENMVSLLQGRELADCLNP